MNKTPNEYAATVLWLLPAEPAREVLRRLVARLAEECDGPIFEPHLTLGFGAPDELTMITAAPIRLDVTGVAFSPQFTKTLFVRLQTSLSLHVLRQSLGIDFSDAFDPHISLLYRRLPEVRQAQLAGTTKLPFTHVLFDAIAAIRCGVPTASRADVEAWETVVARRLG